MIATHKVYNLQTSKVHWVDDCDGSKANAKCLTKPSVTFNQLRSLIHDYTRIALSFDFHYVMHFPMDYLDARLEYYTWFICCCDYTNISFKYIVVVKGMGLLSSL